MEGQGRQRLSWRINKKSWNKRLIPRIKNEGETKIKKIF